MRRTAGDYKTCYQPNEYCTISNNILSTSYVCYIHSVVISEFPNQSIDKIWSKTIVFSSQLRQFPQMIVALNKYTGYMYTSSLNCMMSSSGAMEILCITNIGSTSSKKIAGVEKLS